MLPTILELSFVGFRTSATETASEVIEFLATAPHEQAVIDFHVSERAQARLQRLLALNSAGLLSEEEQHELDELEQIEHILFMLKTNIFEKLPHQN
jgi:hypothetical protein